MTAKRPLWPWIVGSLVLLPVFYVLSFGPACWHVSRMVIPQELTRPIYKPIIFLSAKREPFGPVTIHPLAKPLIAYGELFDENPIVRSRGPNGCIYIHTVAHEWTERDTPYP